LQLSKKVKQIAEPILKKQSKNYQLDNYNQMIKGENINCKKVATVF